MAKPPFPEYILGFRVSYISFQNHPIHTEDVRQLIKSAYAELPWLTAVKGKRLRVLPARTTMPASAVVACEREVIHDAAYVFSLNLSTRVAPSDLTKVEQYRRDFASAIRDLGHDGLWNVSVEVMLRSAEPYMAFAPDQEKYWDELHQKDVTQS